MTHYPQVTKQRNGLRAVPLSAVSPMRDVLWGRPLFKAPSLPNPRVVFDPLPFTATRVTHRGPETTA
jgi:hypothetical protein